MPTGAYTAASVMVMAMIGPTSSRAASIAARMGDLPKCRWRSTFSTMTMASSTTRPTESTMANSVSRLMVKPATSMRNTAPISETGMATIGIRTERNDPRNKKMTTITMHSVSVSVLSTSLIASWMYAVESHILVVILRAQVHIRDLAQANDNVLVLLVHQLAELLGRPQVRVGDQVDRDHGSLGLAQRGKVIVFRERVAHGRGRNAKGRHLVGLQPDAHREGAIAENVGPLHAADGAELGLHYARQIVGDLVLVQAGGRETDVHRGELIVCRLQIDDRLLGFGRQVVAHLRQLRLDLGQGSVGVVVQLQVHGDRAQALRARRLHVVDAVSAGDHPLDGRSNEAAHQVRVGADVDGRHLDDGDVAARILPHAQGTDRLQPGDQDNQIDDNGQDGPSYEEVCKLHRAVLRG